MSGLTDSTSLPRKTGIAVLAALETLITATATASVSFWCQGTSPHACLLRRAMLRSSRQNPTRRTRLGFADIKPLHPFRTRTRELDRAVEAG